MSESIYLHVAPSRLVGGLAEAQRLTDCGRYADDGDIKLFSIRQDYRRIVISKPDDCIQAGVRTFYTADDLKASLKARGR